MICLGFGVWSTPGPGSPVGGVALAFGTFAELMQRSVQNLGGDWF